MSMENTEEAMEVDDIGTILKSSRLKQKKEIESISNELCIRKIYLTALEEGDYETLPPIPYGVGYVRTYARYLGLNPERAVKLYKAASIKEEQREDEKEETPEVNRSNHWHILVAILVLALIYGGWSWYVEYNKTNEPKVEFEEIIIQDSPENLTEVKKDIEQSEIVEILETAEAETEAAPLEEEIVTEEKETAYPEDKVVVEFVGESWVELKDKKQSYFQGVFHEGDRKEIAYTDNLFISAGRPENVKVYIKGVEKNILEKRRKTNIPLDSLN